MKSNIPTQRSTLALIWSVAVAMLLVTWWHVGSLIMESRNRELLTAERDLANLTRVSQEHAVRTFRATDQVIRFIQARYLEIGNKLDLTKLSAQGVIDTEIFPQVGIIDAHGIYALANRPITSRLDLSDREHFKVHVAADTGELFVSKPVLGRSTGKWSIQLTRRITRPNGEFAGVVVVSIDPGYFTRFYNDLKLGDQGVVALYGLDRIARARKVGDKEEFGGEATGARLFKMLGDGLTEGSYTSVSVVDGIERMYYFRKLPRYPLVVVDGVDTKTLFANYHRARDALLLQAFVLSLLILVLATALSSYLKKVSHEIKERRAAQGRAEDRTAQLDGIFALSPDGFVSFDETHHVKFASPAFTKLTGLGREEIVGMDEEAFSTKLASACNDLLPFKGIASLRAVRADDRKNMVSIQLRSNGRRILEVGLRESQARTVSQILYFRDITYETEVDRMKSEFLTTAAHELRTPMASIYGFSEILLSQNFSESEQQEFLNIIYNQSELMISIINELLDLARIEARRGQDFVMKPVTVDSLVQEVVTNFKPPKGRSAPSILFSTQAATVFADKNKMQQAIMNILSNAYKYSGVDGRVGIEIVTPETSASDLNELVGVCVRDAGIGMTGEQASRVFERFYRADSSGKILGTGLGMSIVKEIVELHGGRVEVDSTLGKGTSVTVWLHRIASSK
ncbi:MAG: ATP-binding protein [Sideroxydans sp.]|jgi:PAS domain S-box-containing protein